MLSPKVGVGLRMRPLLVPRSRIAVELVAFTLVLLACSGGSSSPSATPELGATHAAPSPASAAPPAAAPAATGSAPAPAAPAAAAPTAPPPATAPPAAPPEGAQFRGDAWLLYRIAACGEGAEPVDHVLGQLRNAGDPRSGARVVKIIEHHCKAIRPRLTEFRATYFEKGRAWFERVVPRDVPATVVYPFGGGDLLSALVAFPDATEITTISLELAGDPRRLRTLPPVALERSLGALRIDIGGLISVGSNTSENLSNQQRNDLPGQVSSFLLALVAAGYNVSSMRYFTLDDTGQIHYLAQAEIDELDGTARKSQPRSLKHDWLPPSFSQAFANVEIQYHRPGESTVRVHRHIAWNLGDAYLAKHPQLLRHLEKKGRVTMLTKGASYLLYRGDFSLIRGYMLDHLAWMLSDSTGIPPTFARPAGMVQETYGRYAGAFLEGAQANRHDESFVELWKSQAARRLPFRFGYVDKDKQAHVVVTRPK
jgi:hypothetical protein